jgi:hypothetical protein
MEALFGLQLRIVSIARWNVLVAVGTVSASVSTAISSTKMVRLGEHDLVAFPVILIGFQISETLYT